MEALPEHGAFWSTAWLKASNDDDDDDDYAIIIISAAIILYNLVLFPFLDLFVDFPPQRLGIVAPK